MSSASLNSLVRAFSCTPRFSVSGSAFEFMPVAQGWKRISDIPSAPRDEQEADIILDNVGPSGECPAARWRATCPLQAAFGALLLACILAATAGAIATRGPHAVWRSSDPAHLRRLNKGDQPVDWSRNPFLRRVGEGDIADDITAAFSVRGGSAAPPAGSGAGRPTFSVGSFLSEGGGADGTAEAQGDEESRAALPREEPRDERSFGWAFPKAGSAADGERDHRAFEKLIEDLPSSRRLARGAFS